MIDCKKLAQNDDKLKQNFFLNRVANKTQSIGSLDGSNFITIEMEIRKKMQDQDFSTIKKENYTIFLFVEN